MKKTITHPLLGTIILSQSRRSRRISLSIRPPANIRLSFPPNIALSQALSFVDSKEQWAIRILAKYEALHSNQPIAMPYATRKHHLELNPCEVDSAQVKLNSARIVVSYPLSSHYTDSEVQQSIKKGIELAWRLEAKQLLPPRVEQLSGSFSLAYRSITVRNTVSKWGSCSARDDLSLSLHLMRLPDHLIDYIILHELAHTVHKNHSSKFYALLNRLTDGMERELNRELKGYSPRW